MLLCAYCREFSGNHAHWFKNNFNSFFRRSKDHKMPLIRPKLYTMHTLSWSTNHKKKNGNEMKMLIFLCAWRWTRFFALLIKMRMGRIVRVRWCGAHCLCCFFIIWISIKRCVHWPLVCTHFHFMHSWKATMTATMTAATRTYLHQYRVRNSLIYFCCWCAAGLVSRIFHVFFKAY